ncbi:MAG: 16S rRNA processing protein RimM [Firmicutes bacterium]|nr:16S rRNA processing protein RimM [Bacillota bacterium]
MPSPGPGKEAVIIGKVVRPVGGEGWVSVEPYTDFPERFSELTQVWAAGDANEQFPLPLAVEGVDYSGGKVLLAFTGITEREKAQRLVGHYLLIPKKWRFDLPKDRFYIDDLVGLEVVSPGGVRLGAVKSVVNNPGNDLLVIDKPEGEILLPMVKEFVHRIDLDKRQVVATIPPGLEEI